MRRLITIISAILLALIITGAVLIIQGKDLNSLFKTEETSNETDLKIINDEPEIEEELNLSYEEHIEKGDFYSERGFLTLASNEYVRAANLEPTRIEPYLRLIDTHLELRNYNKALSNVKLVLERNPNHLKTRFNEILIYIKLSDFDSAKNLLDQYPVGPVPEPKVLYYRGLLSALFGNHDLSVKYLKEAATAGTEAELRAYITNVLDAYEEFSVAQEAEELYRSELIARAFNKNKEYEMSIYLLKDVLKSRSDLRDGWILLGFAYLNLEKFQFALTAFDKAYSLDSTWPITQYFLGVTNKELGRFKDSIVYFNLAISNNFQPDIVVQSHLADLYFETKEFEKSAAAYESVLEVSKDDINAYIRPVWLYLDYVNDPRKALRLSQTAAVTFPDAAMSYNLLGWSYFRLGDELKAEKNLIKALSIDPDLSAAHFNLGELYELQGNSSKALISFQKAYELDSSGSIGNMAAERYNELLKATN